MLRIKGENELKQLAKFGFEYDSCKEKYVHTM